MTDIVELDERKITFSEPKKNQIKGVKGSFVRVEISYDGEPLIIKREDVESFGIWGYEDANNFSFNLILKKGSKETQTEKQRNDKMESVIKTCFKHARKQGALGNRPKPSKSDFERFSPLKRTEKGIALNVKTIYSKKKAKFYTEFYDDFDKKVDPEELMKTRQNCDVAIKVDSIYAGSLGVFLQLRLLEAIVESYKVERLLSPRSVVEDSSSDEEPRSDEGDSGD